MTSPDPACWSWTVTATDLDDAKSCPEHFGHVLLWNWQCGQCATCGKPSSEATPLVRDHDHETELVRGLLCKSCNIFEGFALAASKPDFTVNHGRGGGGARSFGRWRDKNKLRIEQMVKYRAVNPASLLGLTARHAMMKVPTGLMLPMQYEHDLPIIDVEPGLWASFYRASRTKGAHPDNRLSLLHDYMRWYLGEPGAEQPQLPLAS